VAEETPNLGGVERAAVLLLTLGEANAAEVLRHMGPREVQRVGSAMASLRNVSQAQVNLVLEEFLEKAGSHTALGVDSETYIRRVLVDALGEEKAGGLMERILLGGSAHGLEMLKWMEPRAVAEMVRPEHPQIIALVLSYLDCDHAAAVLFQLPDATRADVVLRIATLDAVQPAAIQELNQILEKRLSGGAASIQSRPVGGVKTAADILNFLETAVEGEIMDQINDSDGELGQRIQELMFVFENMIDLDNTAIQAVLREVSSDSLMLALKGADENLKAKFFGNMSKRAAEMMREDMEAKGPVRVSEVEVAQKEIVGIAQRLAEEGQIALGGKGGEEYV
jgi:flagellar motor switch protein FliG